MDSRHYTRSHGMHEVSADGTLPGKTIEEYTYQSLNEGCIRLLELIPGQNGEAIRVRIFTINIKELNGQPYEALSYAWGSLEDSRTLFIEPSTTETSAERSLDTTFLSITRNLHEALSHIRHTGTSRIFWVDAICINQKDVEERSSQVQLMSLIFRSAKRTTLWLGPAADNSDLIFILFRNWSEYLTWDYQKLRTKFKKPAFGEDSWLNGRSKKQHLDMAFLKAFQALIGRPWFRRLWVRQEVVLSEQHADIVCGYESLPWECFRIGLYKFEFNVRSTSGMPEMTMVHDLITTCPVDFRKLLTKLRRTECSDARDKIYGVLGLISKDADRLNKLFRPDYKITIRDLYISVGKTLIENDKNLSILRLSHSGIDDSDLPSWVPDWRNPPTTNDNLSNKYAGLNIPYLKLIIEKDVLLVRGVQASSVVGIEPFRGRCDSYKKLYKTMHRIITNFTKVRRDIDYKELVTALIRTIQNDRTFTDFSIHEKIDFALCDKINIEYAADLMVDFLSRPLAESCTILDSNPILSRHFNFCCNCMWWSCFNRAMVLLDSGQIALSPKATKLGDIAVVLFGSYLPIILRPQGSGCYSLVGEAFAPGLNHGEALVGDFAYPWSFIKYYRIGGCGWQIRFRNRSSGSITALDPRIDWSQLEVDDEDPRRVSTLSKEYGRSLRRPDEDYLLRNHPQLQIETFKLI